MPLKFSITEGLEICLVLCLDCEVKKTLCMSQYAKTPKFLAPHQQDFLNLTSVLCNACPLFKLYPLENKMILRLPPELRLQIYRLLLLSDQTVRMTWCHAIPRPNCLFPTILRTCRLIHNEAMSVLYGENVFRAHRINDANINAASIIRAKFLIGRLSSEDGERDASTLPSFIENHPSLEHLVLEFDYNLLEDSELRDYIRRMLFRSRYSSRLVVRSDVQSKRSFYNAAQLEEMVASTAFIRNEYPEDFKKVSDNVKNYYRTI